MAVSLSGFKDYSGWGATPSPIGALEKESTPDAIIQSHMGISERIVRNMLGLTADEALPNDESVDHSIYLLTLFFLENVSSQENTSRFEPASELSFQKVSFYRQQVYPALLRQVNGMTSHLRKYSRFIPDLKASNGS